MAILSGKRLGPYEILSAIGAGGMGEVYKARDTRLDRIVAIKVLPPHLADCAELRERFEREARTIASLNHPHICTLHDTGHQDGIDYLVMEYLEGETLAQRLVKGSLPIQQALQYAIEISDALDKAHRKGVTHRDLKPGNIILTKTGTKLLDFGLAKLKQEAAPATPDSQLPTIKSAITGEGTILGTMQYMAPEQVEAKDVDARTDIFAFGAVVYEMATGKKAFEGKSAASVMAKIMEAEPPSMASLQPMTPPALDRVVKKCLAKEPEKRWQVASDLCDELKWIAEQGLGTQAAMPVSAGTPKRGIREHLGWLIAVVAIVAAAALAAVVFYFHRPSTNLRAIRFTVSPPEKQTFPATTFPISFLSVSPDGNKLAFIAIDSTGHSALWIRDLGSQTSQPVAGTDGASRPFWSPDSRFVAFSTATSLKKVAVEGGSTETIANVPANAMGTWNRDGVILLGPGGGNPILRVPSAGGPPTPVTSVDISRRQVAHVWPNFLPDGNHFLFLALNANPENSGIYVGSLDSKEMKLVLKANSFALYSPPGYLLFCREGTLIAQPFDAGRLELKGEAIPIAEGVEFNPGNGRGTVAVSENGVLAYRLASTNAQIKLVWVDRKGSEQPLPAPPHAYRVPRISPDGRRIGVGITDQESQVWLYDLSRETLTRLTFGGSNNIASIWTPDGKRVAFVSNKEGQRNIFWQMADGSGGLERLTTSEGTQIPASWSPDGQILAFSEIGPSTGYDIWTLRLSDRKAQPFLQTPFNEAAPQFSPDGRWLAYASNESGRYEIYVQPYPGPGGKWQISTDGGTEPVWARNGELFYRNGDKMMAVETTTRSNFSADKPKMLFEGHYATYQSSPNYDVTPDGQRFLLTKTGEQGAGEISVVVNWLEELKQKSPTGKN
jgi:serine/threonine protein kinase